MSIQLMYIAGIISFFAIGVIVGIMISVYAGRKIAQKQVRGEMQEIEDLVASAILEVENDKAKETV